MKTVRSFKYGDDTYTVEPDGDYVLVRSWYRGEVGNYLRFSTMVWEEMADMIDDVHEEVMAKRQARSERRKARKAAANASTPKL